MNKIVTEYKFPQNFYFDSILKKLATLVAKESCNTSVIDYGCGHGKLKSFIRNADETIKVSGYDIDPHLSEIEDPFLAQYDIWVFNHVLMYMDKTEILNLLSRIKIKNPESMVIVGVGRQNYLSKLGACILNTNAHKGISSVMASQLEAMEQYLDIIYKENIFFMTDVFVCKFK